MFCCCFLFLPISVRPIISKFTGPIFVKFAGLVELLLEIINLKMVFFDPTQFLVLSTTQSGSGDIRQMASAYCNSGSGWVSLDGGG